MINFNVTEHISVVTFGNIPYESESDFIYRLFRLSEEENINIDMISRASVSTDRTSVGFTFSDDDISLMLKVLGSLRFYRPPLVSCGNVKISVKTSDMINGKGFAMKVFSVLSELNITPILVTTSEDEISVVVRASDSSDFEKKLKSVFLC